jgi:hypothetical protein
MKKIKFILTLLYIAITIFSTSCATEENDEIHKKQATKSTVYRDPKKFRVSSLFIKNKHSEPHTKIQISEFRFSHLIDDKQDANFISINHAIININEKGDYGLLDDHKKINSWYYIYIYSFDNITYNLALSSKTNFLLLNLGDIFHKKIGYVYNDNTNKLKLFTQNKEHYFLHDIYTLNLANNTPHTINFFDIVPTGTYGGIIRFLTNDDHSKLNILEHNNILSKNNEIMIYFSLNETLTLEVTNSVNSSNVQLTSFFINL